MHYNIIRFYNSKTMGLLTAYWFTENFLLLARVVWIPRQSCILTLAWKFKLKIMKKSLY